MKSIAINPSFCSAPWEKETTLPCSFVLRNKSEVWSERALLLPLSEAYCCCIPNILGFLLQWSLFQLKEISQHLFFSIWTFFLLYQNTLVSELLSNTLFCCPKPRSFSQQGTTAQVLIFTEKEKAIWEMVFIEHLSHFRTCIRFWFLPQPQSISVCVFIWIY